jgi:hypothetical protein
MEDSDRELYLAIRDAMLAKASWSVDPLLLSLIIRIEIVKRTVKATKKSGETTQRVPLIAAMEKDMKVNCTIDYLHFYCGLSDNQMNDYSIYKF